MSLVKTILTKIGFNNGSQPAINDTNLNQMQTNIQTAISTLETNIDTEIGQIIESGSNTNGSYIKFSDGTMICTKQVSITADITSTWGNMYDTGNQDIDLGDYAEAFISVPRVSITMASANGCWLEGCSNRTATSFGQVVLASATSKTATVNYDLIAIGKWK